MKFILFPIQTKQNPQYFYNVDKGKTKSLWIVEKIPHTYIHSIQSCMDNINLSEYIVYKNFKDTGLVAEQMWKQEKLQTVH